MPTKPQSNYTPGTSKDDLFTPGYALLPLLPYLPKDKVIWEGAVGSGLLANTLTAYGYQVIASGFQTSDTPNAENFLAGYTPAEHWDIHVTNPPFSEKLAWFARLFALGKPFAVLVQDDTPATGGFQELVAGMDEQPGLLWFSPRVAFRPPHKTLLPGLGWTWEEWDEEKKKIVKKSSSAQFGTLWITWGLGFNGRNVYDPRKNWGRKFRQAWENWHEGWGAFPG